MLTRIFLLGFMAIAISGCVVVPVEHRPIVYGHSYYDNVVISHSYGYRCYRCR
jgi:hypothetical protein